VQQAIACADHAPPANGAYKATAANKHTHAATILFRSWLEVFTFATVYDA
jgi:hypothetical protein